MNRIKLLTISTITTLILTLSLFAQISPGKLSSFHEKFEGIKNCTLCHELGKAQTNAKCLECHSSLSKQTDSVKGYHISSEVESKKCSKCHSEHHGRDYVLVMWENGENSFNHSLTGFELKGKHSDIKCRECHRIEFVDKNIVKSENVNSSRTYLGLDQACLYCHTDEHRAQFTQDCLDCHIMKAWKPAEKFDHNKSDYALTGKHINVECLKCHYTTSLSSEDSGNTDFKIGKKEQSATYAVYDLEGRFPGCTPCHQDIHQVKLGTDCAKCHNTESFQNAGSQDFNHNLTGYPLNGKHVSVKCNECHQNGYTARIKVREKCIDCHEDIHLGQFADRSDGGDCKSCHDENAFIPALYTIENHNTSKYPLTGSHLAIPCFLCHKQVEGNGGTTYAQFDFDKLNCQSCHKDIHNGQLDIWINKSGCEFCHSPESWHTTTFDHNLSRFKLEGKHRQILCLECHKIESQGEEVMWIKPLKMECNSCHKDIHYGQFAEGNKSNDKIACQRCHTPEDWKNLKFNHNVDSRFRLEGAHARLSCEACHKYIEDKLVEKYRLYKPMEITCVACHGKTDVELPGLE
ncbi:cytochrome C [Calditrichota bacterium]